MLGLLKPAESASYAVLRIVTGLAFSIHGFQKLFGVLTDQSTDLGSQLWIGGVIELGGILIAIGLLTRPFAVLASGTMAVAYIQYHWQLRLDENFFPAKNGGELALVYCFLFLFIALRGGGSVSLDRLIFGKRD